MSDLPCKVVTEHAKANKGHCRPWINVTNLDVACTEQTVSAMSPTVHPVNNFDAAADAKLMRQAMKGIGTDENTIIKILCRRDIVQRLEIAEIYKTNYKKSMIQKLKSELSGNLLNVVIALMTPLPYLYAKDLHNAAAGLGSDEETIVEILCTSNYGIRTICAFYEKLYEKNLEFELKNDTSGQANRLFMSMCKATRDETQTVDEDAATADAEELARVEERQWCAENSFFNTILINRSYLHLQKIFTKYQAIKGEDIEESIKKGFTGSVEKAVLALVKCIKSKVGFYAERLYYSMKGLGTNDKILIRIVVSRSEIDLGEIKQTFLDKYGESLGSWICDDTSGDYGKALLTIVG